MHPRFPGSDGFDEPCRETRRQGGGASVCFNYRSEKWKRGSSESWLEEGRERSQSNEIRIKRRSKSGLLYLLVVAYATKSKRHLILSHMFVFFRILFVFVFLLFRTAQPRLPNIPDSASPLVPTLLRNSFPRVEYVFLGLYSGGWILCCLSPFSLLPHFLILRFLWVAQNVPAVRTCIYRT